MELKYEDNEILYNVLESEWQLIERAKKECYADIVKHYNPKARNDLNPKQEIYYRLWHGVFRNVLEKASFKELKQNPFEKDSNDYNLYNIAIKEAISIATIMKQRIKQNAIEPNCNAAECFISSVLRLEIDKKPKQMKRNSLKYRFQRAYTKSKRPFFSYFEMLNCYGAKEIIKGFYHFFNIFQYDIEALYELFISLEKERDMLILDKQQYIINGVFTETGLNSLVYELLIEDTYEQFLFFLKEYVSSCFTDEVQWLYFFSKILPPIK